MEDFYNSSESVEQYIKMAKGHDGSDLIKILDLYLSKGQSILEIGSGPGSDFKTLSENYEVTGSDYSDEFLNRLKKQFPKSDFLKIDAKNINIDSKFDCIYSNKVLHHLNDEELKSSIDKQKYILNKEGVLCHSFWLGNGSEEFKGLFVNLHLIENIRDFFSDGFQIIEINTYDEFEQDDSIFIIVKKL